GELAGDGVAEAGWLLEPPGARVPYMVDHRGYRRHVGVVEQHQAADLQVRRQKPPVQRRVGKGVGADDENEVELARLPAAEDVGGAADPESQLPGRDPAAF